MKKRTIISLIVAAVLIVTGGTILILGLSYAGEGTSTPVLTEREVAITEPFAFASIIAEDCDVSIELVQS